MGYWVWKERIEGVRPTLRLSRGTLIVGVEPGLVLASDLEGRPWRLIDGPLTYRWSLSGEALCIERRQDGRRDFRRISLEESAGLIASLGERLAPLLEAAGNGSLAGLTWHDRVQTGAGDRPALDLAIGRLAAWDLARARHDARRYGEVYSPVGILPPDQYLSLVVQLTEGCSFNTCTFCTFYREIPFRVRDPQQLEEHMQAVDAFLGEGLRLRRSLFLGDANALVTPMSRLEPLVEAVGRHYAERAPWLGGMHAFLDGFSGTKKSVADFERLKGLGLERVSVGMESGHDPLLAWLRKPGKAEDVVEAVDSMKSAGLAVTVIVLLGAGGTRFDAEHVHDTADRLASMPLDGGDIVYFSEYVDQPDAPYGIIAAGEGIEALGHAAMQRQRAQISSVLRPTAVGGPHTAAYDIREFTY